MCSFSRDTGQGGPRASGRGPTQFGSLLPFEDLRGPASATTRRLWRLALRRLDDVTEVHEAVIERLARREPEARLPCEAARIRDLEDARDAGGAIDRRGKEDAELVDHAGRHHRAVHVAAAFDEETQDAKLSSEHLEERSRVHPFVFSDDVRDAVVRELSEMAVGYAGAEEHDDVIAADVRLAEVELAGAIERDRVAVCIAPREVVRTRDGKWPLGWVRVGLAHLRHRDAPNEPRVAREGLVHPLVSRRPHL